MNKQELIESIENLNKLYRERKYVAIDDVLSLVSLLDEPKKVKVPQFVANWYEENKDDFEGNLFREIDLIPMVYKKEELSKFQEWVVDALTKPFQTLVNMHQIGYEVEEEKRYIIKFKNIQKGTKHLKYDRVIGKWYFGLEEYSTERSIYHTKKELEEAGFDWVFDCEGIEIEEVE